MPMPINHAARAAKAWPILVRLARSEAGLITYGQLTAQIGLHHRAAAWFLGVIQTYCKRNRLPPLQALAVNKRTRLPGKGYVGSARSRAAHSRAVGRVYAHKWSISAPRFGI